MAPALTTASRSIPPTTSSLASKDAAKVRRVRVRVRVRRRNRVGLLHHWGWGLTSSSSEEEDSLLRQDAWKREKRGDVLRVGASEGWARDWSSVDEREEEEEEGEESAALTVSTGEVVEEEERQETFEGVGGGGGGRKALRLDRWALGGTVVTTCMVAFVGVSEVPTFVLALPVVLPMLAMLSYRDRVGRKHKQELALALRNQSQVSSQVGLLVEESSAASRIMRNSVTQLSHRLLELEEKIAVSSESQQVSQAEVEKRFDQLMRMTRSATNHLLKEQVKNMRQIVGEEIALSASESKDDTMVDFLETNILDVKRELSELERIQTDLLRLVETFYDETKESNSLSAASFAAVEGDWIKDELREMRNSLAGDVEDIVVRNANEKVEALQAAAAGRGGGEYDQLEDRLVEIRQVAEQNQQSIRDMQDTIYSSSRNGSKGAASEEEFVEEIRGISSSVDTLVDSLDALQALPDVVENFSQDIQDIRETIRETAELNSSFLASGGTITNMQEVSSREVSSSFTSTSVFKPAALEDLENKIDDLTRATGVFEKLSSQLNNLNTKILPEGSGSEVRFEDAVDIEGDSSAGASGGKIAVEEEKEDSASASEGTNATSWLEYAESEEELEPIKVAGEAKAGSSVSQSQSAAGAEVEEPVLSEATQDEVEGEGEVEGEVETSVATEGGDEKANLSVDDLLGEGLGLLRKGRKELQDGDGIASGAESCFTQALEYFDQAIALDPNSVAAFGNKGNTLLASSRQKMRLLNTFRQEARENPMIMNEESIRMSEDLTRETSQVLVESGRCFRTVLSLNPRDSRALLNWGNALCLRAKLVDSESAYELYQAALEKFTVAQQLSPESAAAERAIDAANRDLNNLM